MIARRLAGRIALAAIAAAALGLAIVVGGVLDPWRRPVHRHDGRRRRRPDPCPLDVGPGGHDRRRRGRDRRGRRERRPRRGARKDARPAARGGRGGRSPDRRRRLRGPCPARGTRGARQPRRFVQPDGGEPRGPGADAARLHRQRRARAADAADEPAGLSRGAPRWRHRGRPRDLRVTAGTRPTGSSDCRARSIPSPKGMLGPRRRRSWRSTWRQPSGRRWSSRRRRSSAPACGSSSMRRPRCRLGPTPTSSRRSWRTCCRTRPGTPRRAAS